MFSRSPRVLVLVATATLFALIISPACFAQGLIVDTRPNVRVARSFDVKEISLDARIRDQVAEVQISQVFANPNSTDLEVEYFFPVPDTGAVQSFVLLVDGKEFAGRLLPKEEARRIYEGIVRSKRDPALLEYIGRDLIRTSVFPIPPGGTRKVTLQYTQLCRREGSSIEFGYPLGTQKFTTKPIERLAVHLDLSSQDSIKSIYSPSHELTVKREGDRRATASLEARDVLSSADLRLIYSLSDQAFGVNVFSHRPSAGEDGYFMVLASPGVKAVKNNVLPKTVILTIDRSGSMSGKKMEQARNAAKFVINRLNDGDTFNIVAYDNGVDVFKPELQGCNDDSRREALRFVENLREGGSTNINGALSESLRMIADRSRPSYVLFLTDGLPTTGEVKELAIAQNARDANTAKARIYAFGVGYDVNARLLDRLSTENNGYTEFVKPDEDIEAAVARYASRMTRSALANVKIRFDGVDVNRAYPRELPDLFEGSQIVWVGRYRQSGPTTLTIQGNTADGSLTQDFKVELTAPGGTARHDFVEKIWALRRVGEIIDQIDLNGKNTELTNELVTISQKYGILTPYTSFLADDTVHLHAATDNLRRAQTSLGKLSEVDGYAGVSQRAIKGEYKLADQAGVTGMGGFGGGKPGLGGGMGGMGGGRGGAPTGSSVASAPRRQEGLSAALGRAPSAPNATPSRPNLSVNTISIPPTSNAQRKKALEVQAPLENNVRQIGGKTFFRKNQRWIDSTVTPDKEAKAVVIKQFSEEYFALLARLKPENSQYLVFEESCVVELDGRIYLIEQEQKQVK